jgi:hypothetical protein
MHTSTQEIILAYTVKARTFARSHSCKHASLTQQCFHAFTLARRHDCPQLRMPYRTRAPTNYGKHASFQLRKLAFTHASTHAYLHLCLQALMLSSTLVRNYECLHADLRARILNPHQGQIFLLVPASRPAMGPTQPPIKWVPGVLSPGVKRGRGVTLSTHPI